MSTFTTISSDKLARLIGTANAPALIDVRTEEDFAADRRLIAFCNGLSADDLDRRVITDRRDDGMIPEKIGDFSPSARAASSPSSKLSTIAMSFSRSELFAYLIASSFSRAERFL